MSNRKATLTIEGQAPIELPILKGTLGQDVIDIGTLGSHNVFTYDPGFSATAACQSDITYIDGNKGILLHRGYPIEQLAEKSTYLEVAYLLLNGELPNAEQLKNWNYEVTHHTMIHENMRKRFVDGFHYDAHPMGMFVSAIAALGTFYTGF